MSALSSVVDWRGAAQRLDRCCYNLTILDSLDQWLYGSPQPHRETQVLHVQDNTMRKTLTQVSSNHLLHRLSDLAFDFLAGIQAAEFDTELLRAADMLQVHHHR